MLTRLHALLIAIEQTPGTDETPDGTDAVRTIGPPEVAPQPEIFDTDIATQSLDAFDPIVGRTPMQVRFQVPMHGSGGDADDPPEFAAALKACGFAEDITVSTGPVVYKLASASIPTATIYAYRDGIVWKVVGCRGDLTINMQAGGIWTMDFTFSGLLGGKEDAAIPALTYDDVIPPVWKNGKMEIATVDAAVRSASIALNNQLSYPDNPNAAEGFDPPEITGRNVQGTMDPMETLVATRNIFGDFLAGNKKALNFAIGGTAQNRCTLAVTAAQYRGEQQTDDAGKLRATVPFSCTGKDDGVITLTFD